MILDWFGSNEGYVQTALVTTLLAASLQIALRAGVISFAGIGFYGAGAYGSAHLQVHLGWSFALTVVVVLAGVLLASVALALILTRLRALYLAMATIAFVLLMQVVALAWDDVTGGALGIYGVPPHLGTGGVAIVVAVTAAVVWATQRGSRGRQLALLRRDEVLAGALGDNVRRRHQLTFVASGVVGGVAGLCQADLLTVFTPENVGFGVLVGALTALVVGGTWHWTGPLAGALIFAWLPVWVAFLGEWRELLAGAVTIAVLIFVPGGITGAISAAARRLRHRRRGVLPAPVPSETDRLEVAP